MIRWLRATLPATWMLVVIGLLYLVLLGISPIVVIHPGLMGLMLGAYAIYRIFAFHPRYRVEYRHWLEIMPWDGRKPLPFGPVRLMAQDVLIVAVIIALASVHLDKVIIWVLAFLLIYLASAAFVLFQTQMFRAGCLVLFLIGLLIHVWWMPRLALIVAVLAYFIAIEGLRRGLRRFPWGMEPKYIATYDFGANRPTMMGAEIAAMGTAGQPGVDILDLPGLRLFKTLAMPGRRPEYDLTGPLIETLSPIDLDRNGRTEKVFLTSFVIGWAFYVLAVYEKDYMTQDYIIAFIFYFIFVFSVSIVRVTRYCGRLFPATSLAGRLLWPRLLVTGYDRGWITPLVCVVIGVVMPFGLFKVGFAFPAAAAWSAAIYFFSIQLAGKPYERWMLEAPGRQIFRFYESRAPQFSAAFVFYYVGIAIIIIYLFVSTDTVNLMKIVE